MIAETESDGAARRDGRTVDRAAKLVQGEAEQLPAPLTPGFDVPGSPTSGFTRTEPSVRRTSCRAAIIGAALLVAHLDTSGPDPMLATAGAKTSR